MKTLIIKYGASGDVVRTTTLLNVLKGDIDWITAPVNVQLLNGLSQISQVFTDGNFETIKNNKYDLVINLEDSFEAAELVSNIKFKNLFGAYLNKSGKIEYTENSKAWFDLSLISKYGIEKANIFKYENQSSFQELVFDGLGFKFNGEPYLLPKSPETNLFGDIAISPKAGKVWPMKNWKYYDELASILKEEGFVVNYLPQRETMLEHLSDVRNHKFLISGDSLPMHFALGSSVKCISLFICTSPTEIFDYGIQKKIISPQLDKYFYRRDYDENAVKSISLENVIKVFEQIKEKKNVYAYC